MKILELRAESFKRLSVVEITPQGNMVEITGANEQGKTSVLDAIWAACGGKDAAPDQPIRKGKKSARIVVKLGDEHGTKYVVERSFTPNDSYLKVTDAEGSKHSKPQQILDGLMGSIGYDPLHFMREKPELQFKTLRALVKLDVDVDALDRKRATIFEERTGLGRDLKNAQGAAAAIAFPDGLPDERPDTAAIVERLAGVDKHNAKIAEARAGANILKDTIARQRQTVVLAEQVLRDAQARLEDETKKFEALQVDWGERMELIAALPDPLDAAAIQAELVQANGIAKGIDLREARITADAKVATLERQAREKTEAIAKIDETKTTAMASAKMPVEGLSFSDGAVLFKGLPLSQASGAERLRVSTAIGAALNPTLRVLLVRDGSLLDSHSLKALAEFAESSNMQVWLEKVNETGEVGVVLVDGHVKGQEALVEAFERGETTQSESQSGNVTQTESAPAVDPERMKRVEAYITDKLTALPTRNAIEELERDNAEVKIKLAKFPEIITGRWNGPYLEALRVLQGRKT